MTDLIRRLAAWLGLPLFPRGAHRAGAALRPVLPPPSEWDAGPPLPAHRSPYGLDTPLDPGAARSVRPYLPTSYWAHGLEGLEAAA